MAFTTQSLKNAALEAFAHCLLAACLCLLWASATWAAAPTEITQLRTERTDDGVYLSAVVRFEVPSVVEDALLKGIAVYFVVEADVYRDRWYWTDLRVASAARTLRLAYQPLTGRWRVNIVSGLITSSSGLRATLSQNYETLPEALSAIQRVSHWKIADAAEVDPGEQYMLNLNFWLDLSQLPRPFQIGVAGQRDWTISAQVRERLRLTPAPSATEGGK
ncbi:DUF4390 domain-containing protein [Polaromonas sp. CG_9.11]|uniref:DUF4390 domain-containing protein n=1 Tax=Polaromonas sp. CG_9.11 TaxID=2787730 RepID=UPI0018C960A7|nr:DUF4390 domain-containing protein [Polaromonas sp. CG_9.11]MBG6077110.1 hypothetical protein [Polaromonas sp. CG_9.11]